ncbi:transglycosylase SLT domain-containing protein [Methylomonas koyamae]|uniref:Lytic transglycosylase n=1 Tax=Methylomonas koyamae TaxID=702114 RepID=A0A291IL14_9GAMM|nr:transglycosylase SLT domain-containing protein [Methylomonas koyamae]ATG90857.1 lytic transglycosylase [Methylomonas koyamae]OAI24301.1 lytic transglycosylase [Methylomonas koyamae]
MSFILHLVLAAAIGSLLPAAATAGEADQADSRQRFVQAEQAIAADREADYRQLAATLKTYPLYPYLQYQWLKGRLSADSEIRQFLADHAASRYAGLLKPKRLAYLGEQQRWQDFLRYYQGSDDGVLQCYAGLAYLETGQSSEAFSLARTLWLSGKSQPNTCDGLFAAYQASPYFTPDLIWQRFHAALKRGNAALAEYLTRYLAGSELELAGLWLKLHRQPESVQTETEWRQHPAQAADLFGHAVERWLERDAVAAAQFWDQEKPLQTLAPARTADIEKQLAMALALKHDAQAYQRLSRLAADDESSREWRVRAALNIQDWPGVMAAIDRLNGEEKIRDKWRYWQARALAATGQGTTAASEFADLAKNRSFYGFLAAAKSGQAIALAHRPLLVAETELQALSDRADFQAVSELLALKRPAEARRQWQFAVARLEQGLLPAAAKLAQRWHAPALAIATVAKANHWDDLELRFPLEYSREIGQNAAERQLDPAIIYGLVRQESAFDSQADSPAGAKGLMQVMPQTGRQIAADLRDRWGNDDSLFQPDLNLKYGAFYFKKLLGQFNGHYALAAAAYNAGASKIKRWLPSGRSQPADIWIENIPYKETRGYVASVLMYSLIYQQRLQRNSLKVDDLLRDVMPG